MRAAVINHKEIEAVQQIKITNQNQKTLNCKRLRICYPKLVNLTATQVETLFGELEYIEPQLKALGVADEGADNV